MLNASPKAIIAPYSESALTQIFTVPPGSEMIVSGSVEDNHHCLTHVTEGIVESKSDSVLAKQGILVAKALVNPSQGRVPLRLMNLTGRPQALHGGGRVVRWCWVNF